jgi:HK97 family phage major capsid protein
VPNSEHMQREFEAYRTDDAAARAILDRAAEETRSTSPEEDEQFDKLFTSAQTHKKRADRLVEMDTDGEALAEAVRSRIGDPSDGDSGDPGGETQTYDQRLVGAILETISVHQHGGDKREINIDVPFDEARIRTVRDEVRAIADFSDNASLYTSDFSTRVAVYQRTQSPWLQLAEVITADNGRPLILPNLTVDPTGYTPGEGTAITESTPTLGTATATPVSYKALSYVSMEAEEDEVVGLMNLISKSQGRQLGLDFGSASTTAILAAATNGGTAGGLGGGSTATFIGYEDLLILKYGVAAPYRLAGTWVMSNGMILKTRRFTDVNGQYLWQPAIAAGQPDRFDGQPVYEDPYLLAPASATKSVLYGDASAWTIKQRPLRVAVSTDYRFNTDQVAIKTVYRAGGALADATALAYMVSATA